jgi:hypothetical protein
MDETAFRGVKDPQIGFASRVGFSAGKSQFFGAKWYRFGLRLAP